ENRELLEEALRERSGRKIEITVPRKGEKRDLVEHARQNAGEALGRKLSEAASQAKLLAALAGALGLARPPRRIEVYDNSHIMGTNAIGAMIVAGADGFMKTHYRTFNIRDRNTIPGDDHAMMREVLRRRFARLTKEDSAVPGDPGTMGDGKAAFPDRPDLILIDGGQGQFDAAQGVLMELGVIGVVVAAIAKGPDRNAGRESLFMAGLEPFKLSPRDPALYFVQRLRDEAHRFAIGTHRAHRKKEFTKSPLDEIHGVGPARKRALLHAFGTAKAISRAALSDFARIPGINAATARLVYDFFHERGRQ
ncbi:MAG: helix-hairpin-helix domain-containing protein, partial [Methylocella sp.]